MTELILNRVQMLLHRNWRWALIAITLVSVVVPMYGTLSQGYPPRIEVDAAFHEHIGWYIMHGGRPYLDVWDIKLPLLYEFMTVLAVIGGGVPWYIHIVSVLVSAASTVGLALIVGQHIYHITQDAVSSMIGGLVLLLMPAFPTLPAYGFREKTPYVLFGLVAIWLAIKQRPFWAGVLGATSMSFHHLGATYAVLSALLALQQGRRSLLSLTGGFALLMGLSLIPVIAWNAFPSMLAQAVFAMLLVGGERSDVVGHVMILWKFMRLGLSIAVLAYGGIVTALDDIKSRWWVIAGMGVFTLQVLLIDLDNFPDMIAWLAFIAIGFGLLIWKLSPPWRWAISSLAVALLALSLFSMARIPGLIRAAGGAIGEEPIAESLYGLPNTAYLFWNQVIPETCHYRYGPAQRRWVKQLGRPLIEKNCDADFFTILPRLVELAQARFRR